MSWELRQKENTDVCCHAGSGSSSVTESPAGSQHFLGPPVLAGDGHCCCRRVLKMSVLGGKVGPQSASRASLKQEYGEGLHCPPLAGRKGREAVREGRMGWGRTQSGPWSQPAPESQPGGRKHCGGRLWAQVDTGGHRWTGLLGAPGGQGRGGPEDAGPLEQPGEAESGALAAQMFS